MAKPRDNPNRELFGIIGSIENISAVKKKWNAFFLKEGIDAFLDSYPTKEAEIPERLSEMYHFDRRGYIVGKPLQLAIIPLLDVVDESVKEEGSVDTVVNSNGVLTGYCVRGDFERRKELWFLAGDLR